MPIPSRLVNEHTDVSSGDLDHLTALVEDWALIADLSLSDLVLWLPTWNDAGAVAVAHVRPTTAPTSVPDEVVGVFQPEGRSAALDQAMMFGRSVHGRDHARPLVPTGVEAYPIHRLEGVQRSADWESDAGRDRGVIGVVVRHASDAPRVAGQLEDFYLSTADRLFSMVVAGRFPVVETVTGASGHPRVGDGVLRVDPQGEVEYASPNAMSALRRLGWPADVVGSDFSSVVTRLSRRHAALDSSVTELVRGIRAGRAEIEGSRATVLLRSIPLMRDVLPDERDGAVILLRDTTDLRRKERALLSKDATIREIHHRVKNNLQTVAALLRLQSRRSADPAVRSALDDAQVRVGAIAVVHEALSAESSDEIDLGETVDFDRIIEALFSVVTGDGSMTIERRGSAGRLRPDVATALAMCLSELMHNAIQHSGGTFVEVGAVREPESLAVFVRDDGRGMPTSGQEVGLGLNIVQSLVETELGGEFEFADEAYGTRAVISINVDM